MVFISVIITAHNRKEYLMQAVDSALNQTLPKTEYEVIVVKNFEDYDEELEKMGVKTIYSNKKEEGRDIMTGVKEAKGDIISILDDDDLFLPRKLEKVKKAFENKDVIFHSHGFQRFKYNNIPSDIRENKDEEIIIDVKKIKKTELKRLLLDPNYLIHLNTSRMSARREVFEENEKLIEEFTKFPFAFDFLLFYVSALYGKLIVYDPEILSLYRVHNKNLSGFNLEFNEWLNKQALRSKTVIEKFLVIRNVIGKKISMNDSYVKTLYESINYYYSLEKIFLKIFLSDEKTYLSDLINVMKFNPNLKFIFAFLVGFSPKKVKNAVIKRFYRYSLV